MAELTTSQSMKQSVRQLTKKASDTWKITGAKLSRSDTKALDVALVKATSSKTHVPPKEKHVRTLKSALMSASSGDYVIQGLLRRLHEATDWLTALKTLITIHRLLAETGEGVWDEVLRSAGLQARAGAGPLGVDDFIDTTNIAGRFDYSEFVRAYGKYLDEQLAVFGALRWNCSANSGGSWTPPRQRTSETEEFGAGAEQRGWGASGGGSWSPTRAGGGGFWSPTRAGGAPEAAKAGPAPALRTMPVDQLLEALPRLQRLQRRLMDCVPRGAASGDAVALAALGAVVQESYRLYRAISEGVINLADAYFGLPRLEAARGLDAYREAVAATEALSAFYGTVGQLGGALAAQSLPTLTPIPADFLTSMEEYLAEAPRPEGEAAPPRPAAPLRKGRLAAPAPAAPSTAIVLHTRTLSSDPGMVMPLGAEPEEEGEPAAAPAGEPDLLGAGDARGANGAAAAPPTAPPAAALSPLDLLLGELTFDAPVPAAQPPQANGAASANPFADPFAPAAHVTAADPFAFAPSPFPAPQQQEQAAAFDPFALSSPAPQAGGSFWQASPGPAPGARAPPPLDLGALQAPPAALSTPASMRGGVAAGTPGGEDLVKAAGARDPFATLSLTPSSAAKQAAAFPSPRTGLL